MADSNDAPVIVSLTSTADSATGRIYPLAHMFAWLQPSLKRQYTNGIFGSTSQTHSPIRQSEFYSKTPGHQPYLINHWIRREDTVTPMVNASSDHVFAANISPKATQNPFTFFTSAEKRRPARAWRITDKAEKPLMRDGLPLSMQHSDYWIMNCGKELISGHGDIWSTTTMEMYAGLYRLATYLKKSSD
jgi:hypothetical protein